jgi:hypothetical protein
MKYKYVVVEYGNVRVELENFKSYSAAQSYKTRLKKENKVRNIHIEDLENYLRQPVYMNLIVEENVS